MLIHISQEKFITIKLAPNSPAEAVHMLLSIIISLFPSQAIVGKTQPGKKPADLQALLVKAPSKVE